MLIMITVFLLTYYLQKTRKIHNTLIILFYGSSSSPQLQKFAFLLKRQKTTNLQRVTSWNKPNLVLKRMEGYFLNIPTLKKLLEFQDWKKDNEAYTKKWNFKPEIKPLIENLQDEFYQLENTQGKDAKLLANIRWEFKVKNASKRFSKYLKDRISKIKQYMNYLQKIINQNILEILWTFSNLQKILWKVYTMETTFQSWYYWIS